MTAINSLNGEVETFEDKCENIEEACDSSTDSGSVISLSEKILLESNEKRLRQRMASLHTSILNLKEQLNLEKKQWKEDIEKIRVLQQQQEETCRCTCRCQAKSKEGRYEDASRSSSNFTLAESGQDIFRKYSVKQLLDFQNYKRKLAETENMCNLELTRMKQSLEDLKTLQTIALEWGKDDEQKDNLNNDKKESIHELFVYNKTAE